MVPVSFIAKKKCVYSLTYDYLSSGNLYLSIYWDDQLQI